MKSLRSIHNKFQIHATGAESPDLFIDNPENVYWTRRMLGLRHDLSEMIGDDETDAVVMAVVSNTALANRVMNICQALETEIEYAKHAEVITDDGDWMDEFLSPDLGDTEGYEDIIELARNGF